MVDNSKVKLRKLRSKLRSKPVAVAMAAILTVSGGTAAILSRNNAALPTKINFGLIVKLTPTALVLTWVAPGSSGTDSITNYEVYRGTASGQETPLTEVGNVLTYTDSNVTGGDTYYYEVAAITGIGTGPPSNEVSAVAPIGGTTTTASTTTTTSGGTTTTSGGTTTTGSTTTTASTTTTTAPPGGELATPASYFGSDVTNRPVTSWSVNSSSAAMVSALEGTGGITTWLNEDRTVLIVPSTQPEVLVAEGTPSNGQNWCAVDSPFSDAFTDSGNQADAPPAGSYDSLFYTPVPSGVFYSNASTDDEVAILQTGSSPQEYDFWLFGEGGTSTGSGNDTIPGEILDPYYSSGSPNPDVNLYDVGNGGQISTTKNPPSFNQCGDTASGLSVAATTITGQDVYNAENYASATGGGIDHALSLEIPYQLCTGDIFPAENPYPDCTGPGTTLQEGDYFRLSSSANCSTATSGQPPLAFMICYALQNYGMIIMDRNTASVGAIYLEGDNPNDWTFDGYSGTDPLITEMGSDNQGNIMSSIPWSDLQEVTPPSCVQSNPTTC